MLLFNARTIIMWDQCDQMMKSLAQCNTVEPLMKGQFGTAGLIVLYKEVFPP